MSRSSRPEQCTVCILASFCRLRHPQAPRPHLEHVYASRGDKLARQGSEVEWVQVLCAGTARVETRGFTAGKLMLGLIRSGQFLGLEDLKKNIHSYSVIALQTCVVAQLPREQFLAGLEQNPRLHQQIWQALAEWTHYLSTRLPSHLQGSVDQRLAAVLLDMAEWHAESLAAAQAAAHAPTDPPSAEKRRLEGRMRRKDLAAMTGISPETVSRHLGQWKARGLITENRKGEITLQSLDRLRRIARRWQIAGSTAATDLTLSSPSDSNPVLSPKLPQPMPPPAV